MTRAELKAHAQAVGLPDFDENMVPTLGPGSTGKHVALLHRLLRIVMIDQAGTFEYDELEGEKYKTATKTMVRSFQSYNHLLADGVAGYKTWLAVTGLEKFVMIYEPPSGMYHTQTNKARCWAAATSTLKALPAEIQHTPASTYYIDHKGGIFNDNPAEPWANNSDNFAKDLNLNVIKSGMSLSGLLYIMLYCGRVMLNSKNLNNSNSHFYVLYSARGDGTDKGTTMGIWDPYPDSKNNGAAMYRSYNWLRQQYKDVTYRVFYSLQGDGKR